MTSIDLNFDLKTVLMLMDDLQGSFGGQVFVAMYYSVLLLYLFLKNSGKICIQTIVMSMNLRHEDMLKLHAAKTILEKEYRYHYTIDELAQKVGTNPFKLKVGFKLLFNSTLFEYLTTVRIDRAKHLLESTEHPVKRIAAEVGYIRPANFIRRFKRITGVLPGDWRKGRMINSQADNDAA